MSCLTLVRSHFPQVKHVIDSKRPIKIEVTKRDNSIAKVKNGEECALAQACKRKFKVDAVLISVDRAYLIKGSKAIRFKNPPSVSREITSFDRKGEGGFLEGTYQLSAIPKREKIGARLDRKRGTPTKSTKRRLYHKTEGIRARLFSGN